MLVRTKQGWQVKSEEGKNLSKPGLSKEAAEERLAQVERFKHLDSWAKKKVGGIRSLDVG